jgi:hypothetical protein
VIDQAVDTADPSELAKRLDILGQIVGDLIQCSENVIDPADAAISNLQKARIAEQWDMLGGGGDYTARAYVKAQEAREALDATT